MSHHDIKQRLRQLIIDQGELNLNSILQDLELKQTRLDSLSIVEILMELDEKGIITFDEHDNDEPHLPPPSAVVTD